ncbi:MAG: GTP-binding protein, partial [Oscillospiraceae bacterium]|nr:GTP-binding protein [Oscillospiraceae bacterium]
MRYLNLGVLAHVDAGKTTLVEHLLYRSGALRAPGSIEKGNTQSDRLAIERERGISVRASSVSLEHGGVRINIIDTPGHIDFTGEAERALSALDAAVLVVSAAEGVQSQTEIFWRALRELGIPTIIFINKIDRMGCDPDAVRRALTDEFGAGIYAVNTADAPGSRACAVGPPAFSDDDVLALCERDGALAEEYLASGEAPGAGRLAASVAGLSAVCAAFPLLHAAAALDIGVAELLDALV